jgi:hypothetical protein
MQWGSRSAVACCKKAFVFIRREVLCDILNFLVYSWNWFGLWDERRLGHVARREEKCLQDFSGEYEENRQVVKT